MSPDPPINDPKMASDENTFSRFRIFGIKLRRLSLYEKSDTSQTMAHHPECLNHRSIARERKNDIAVIVPPVTNRGFKTYAPMSEMYGILLFWEG